MAIEEFEVRCHCGRVRGRFKCETDLIYAWDCNCSDCLMRGNVHCMVKQEDLVVDMKELHEEATILYQWGTKTAVRRFCKTCGILPWYIPRSNPDSFGVSIHCVDWTKGGTRSAPKIQIEKYDGVNWEASLEKILEKTK